MKVGYVTPEDLPIPPVRGGSVQIYTHTLLRHFSQANPFASDEPTIFLISPDKTRQSGWRQTYDNGVFHYTIRAAGKQDYQKQALHVLSQINPDVIQIDNRPKFAGFVKQTMKKPTLVHLYSNTFLGPRHILQNEVKTTLESLDTVVLISRYLRNMIVDKYSMKKSHWNATVIYPGIDTSLFPDSTSVKRDLESFSKEQPLKVLFVGRVIRQKGVQVLVDAVKRLVNAGYPVELTIVGKTHPWEQQYENQVKKSAAGYPVTFTGFVAHEELPLYYSRHHLFVCPSQYREAFGLVNLEAMSSGLPVIGSRVGGIEEILEKGAGMLVDNPHSAESFRAAIAYFLQNPHDLHSQSFVSRARAGEFSWQSTAHRFKKLYQSLTEPLTEPLTASLTEPLTGGTPSGVPSQQSSTWRHRSR
ncbi:glycosyltransferase family 4 protein [Alicyclobacillus sp. SO9]|uniref:glycosyltransferase family 4 protein n=1 Tax=Alicyclobacillus sp. SO9 TaxID=2665646 RepID=UPI0018E6E806|nr:glycosyltransferase family 4 protein [Alicyclobacillus sp. SO9]QQE80308.1 glycosyltransferase family 4 protein [Alicyclobacillus sp. SO9]